MGPVATAVYVVLGATSILTSGFVVGLLVGSHAHFVDIQLTNATVNTTLDGSGNAMPNVPCTSVYSYEARCTFVNETTTWICETRARGYDNETCTEIARRSSP